MQRFLCLILLSGIFNAVMPEGNAKGGVRMITGLLTVRMIAEFLSEMLLNLW